MSEEQAKYGAVPEETSKTAQGRPGKYESEEDRLRRMTAPTDRIERTRKEERYVAS